MNPRRPTSPFDVTTLVTLSGSDAARADTLLWYTLGGAFPTFAMLAAIAVCTAFVHEMHPDRLDIACVILRDLDKVIFPAIMAAAILVGVINGQYHARRRHGIP